MSWPVFEETLTCDISGVDHVVSVSLPARYDKLETAPLVLCLDAPWVFGTAADACRIMSMSQEAPEAVVVGLSFSGDDMGQYLLDRARWYTPTGWVPPAKTGATGLAVDDYGHALVLQSFVADQLLPHLESKYRIDERWIVGHSFSALCALRWLLAKPEMFDKWLLASPSVWWHDRVILDIEAAYAEANDDLPTKVFLSAGADESILDEDDYFRMVSNVEVLGATLASRQYPGLELHREMIPGETHSSVIGPAISRGLKNLVGR